MISIAELSMKYDDASWHYDGDWPVGLPAECASTHIGMFAVWAQLSGIGGDLHEQDLEVLRSRAETPGIWLRSRCDEKLTDEDFSDEGNRFAQWYYASSPNDDSVGLYYADLEETFPDGDTLYEIPDTWSSYDKLKPTLDRRLADWRQAQC